MVEMERGTGINLSVDQPKRIVMVLKAVYRIVVN